MKRVVIYGLPGVGKLTVAREVARLTGYKVFHNHLTSELVESVFAVGSRSYIELKENIRLLMFRHAVENNLTGMIFTFVFEKSTSRDFVDRVLEIVEAPGGMVQFVELTCERVELEKRITDPSRWIFEHKTRSVEKLHDEIAERILCNPILPRQGLVIDTTHLNPVQVAMSIFAQLQTGTSTDG